MAMAFPNHHVLFVDSAATNRPQNFIFVGYRDDSQRIDFEAFKHNEDPFLASLSKRVFYWRDFVGEEDILLVDDYAPADYLVTPILRFSQDITVDSFSLRELAATQKQLARRSPDERLEIASRYLEMLAGSVDIADQAVGAFQLAAQRLFIYRNEDRLPLTISMNAPLDTPGGVDTLAFSLELARSTVAGNLDKVARAPFGKPLDIRGLDIRFRKAGGSNSQSGCSLELESICGEKTLEVHQTPTKECASVVEVASKVGFVVKETQPDPGDLPRATLVGSPDAACAVDDFRSASQFVAELL